MRKRAGERDGAGERKARDGVRRVARLALIRQLRLHDVEEELVGDQVLSQIFHDVLIAVDANARGLRLLVVRRRS